MDTFETFEKVIAKMDEDQLRKTALMWGKELHTIKSMIYHLIPEILDQPMYEEVPISEIIGRLISRASRIENL